MKKITILSALVICISAMDASAKGCTSGQGRCAVSHHSVKHAKRSGMGSALGGAYQR
jgi:hypothetical protein